MPRLRRRAHPRRQSELDTLDALTDRLWLDLGEPNPRSHNRRMLTDRGIELIYSTNREQVLSEWIERHPGTRPRCWWLYDKPEPRRIIGTAPTFAGHGQTRAWNPATETSIECKPGDRLPADDLLLESQPVYLARLGLLTAEEQIIVEVPDPDPGERVDWRSDFQREAFGVAN